MSTPDFSITLRDFDKEIKDFLHTALIGSPGGIQYRVHREKNLNLEDEKLHFLCLSRNKKLIGVVGLVDRTDIQSKRWLYIRYLYITRTQGYPKTNKTYSLERGLKTSFLRPEHQSRGGRSREKHSCEVQSHEVQCYSQSRTKLQRILLEHLEEFANTLTSSQILPAYAFVENKNHQSMKLCKRFGFTKVQEINTFLFHRFSPTLHAEVCLLSPEEVQESRAKLKEFYDGYEAYHTEGLKEQGYFLGYKVHGEWLAMARIMRHRWDVEQLPDHFSFLRRWRVDRLPYLRQLIPGHIFHFVSADYIWFKQGHERCFESILEHALAKEKVHTGMIWLSKESPHRNQLRASVSWGALNKIGDTGNISVVKRVFVGIGQEKMFEKNDGNTMNPIFINAHDMT